MRQRSHFRHGAHGRKVHISRRSWLASAVLGLAALLAASPLAWSMQADGADGSEAEEIASVQAIAKKGGLEPFSTSRTEHFVGLGDADARFRSDALKICESLQSDFLRYFLGRGFKVALPKKRLTVITLKGAASYKAYTGEEPGAMDGGHYDLDTNRLVMFDFRPRGKGPMSWLIPYESIGWHSSTKRPICFVSTRGSFHARWMCPSGSAKGWRRMWRGGETNRRRSVSPIARGFIV